MVVHHWRGERIRITVHAFRDSGRAVSRMDVTGWTGTITGDEGAWASLPAWYVGYLNRAATRTAGYFLIQRVGSAVQVSRLDWCDQRGYDLAYQGVVSVTEVPETGETLFGVQRSSVLVRCSQDGSSVTGEVWLPGHLGNPAPVCAALSDSVWVTDYNTLVRVDRREWTVKASAILSSPPAFVGNPWLPVSERYAAVARPASGDVVIVDAQDLHVTEIVRLGRQPLVAAVLRAGQLVARDWKTGAALFGRVAHADT